MRVALTAMLFLLAACDALAQEWQARGVCDMRKAAGPEGREAQCVRMAADVLLLLPDKAGAANIAVLADFTSNLEKSGATWEAPCRDPQRCPETAYTVVYAFVPRKMLTIVKEKIVTEAVCREPGTASDDVCRARLVRLVRDIAARARAEGMLLAVLACGEPDPGAQRGGGGPSGYELRYALVQIPDVLPMADAGLGATPAEQTRQAARVMDGFAMAAHAPPPGGARLTGSAGPDGAGADARGAAGQEAVARILRAQAPAPVPGGPERRAAGDPAALAVLAAGEVLMQVAVVPSLSQAEMLADRLAAKGFVPGFEQLQANGREMYRVLVRAKGESGDVRRRLAEMGYPGALESIR